MVCFWRTNPAAASKLPLDQGSEVEVTTAVPERGGRSLDHIMGAERHVAESR